MVVMGLMMVKVVGMMVRKTTMTMLMMMRETKTMALMMTMMKVEVVGMMLGKTTMPMLLMMMMETKMMMTMMKTRQRTSWKSPLAAW